MINVRIIDREHQDDINIPNQPFTLFGRMQPSYINGKRDYGFCMRGIDTWVYTGTKQEGKADILFYLDNSRI